MESLPLQINATIDWKLLRSSNSSKSNKQNFKAHEYKSKPFTLVPGQPHSQGLSYPYHKEEMKDSENKVGVRGELKSHCVCK